MADELKPLSEATDIEEFKNLRAAHRAAPEQPTATAAQPEEGTPVIAAEPGTATQVQEEPVPVKSIDDQIKELRKQGKHAAANKLEREAGAEEAKAEIARLKQENESLRKPATEPKPEQKATPQSQQPAADDPEPKATDKDFEGPDGYDKYLRAVTRWEIRQENKKQTQQQQNRSAQESLSAKVTAARTKYPDFDTATAGDMKAGTGLVLTPAMIDFVKESDSAMDVLYYLGKNPMEYARIFVHPPARQLAELGKIEDKIQAPPAAQTATPEKLKPAVTRVAPPPRVLSGADTPEPRSTAEARDFEEFKRLRHKKAS